MRLVVKGPKCLLLLGIFVAAVKLMDVYQSKGYLKRTLVYSLLNSITKSPHILRKSYHRENGTPYKIFIHNLPAEFNTDLIQCNLKYHCFTTDHDGFGPEWYKENGMTVRNTWQFSLDIIMHKKLIKSPYRTLEESEADAYYLPFYSGLGCFCHWGDRNNSAALVERFYTYLSNLRPFQEGKPHVLTLAKIQWEHAQPECPLLMHKLAVNISFIGIEYDQKKGHGRMKGQLIVAPYPSYGHFYPNITKHQIFDIFTKKIRRIRIFLAASASEKCTLRQRILDQFRVNTYLPYDKFMKKAKERSHPKKVEMLHYITPECDTLSGRRTLDWMRRSIFCLQPPGDSPTRKSFYDAVISGCIPVIFTQEKYVKYPFSDKLIYKKFTVTINSTEIENGVTLQKLLARIKRRTVKLKQANLIKYAQMLQYSFPIITKQSSHEDAVKYILDEVEEKLRLNKL